MNNAVNSTDINTLCPEKKGTPTDITRGSFFPGHSVYH